MKAQENRANRFEIAITTRPQRFTTMIVDSSNRVVYQSGEADIPEDLTPGRLLCCIHADDPPAGCGTTPWCAGCGAGTAIRTCIEQRIAIERECTIRTESDSSDSENYRVFASPLDLDGHAYVLVDLENINEQKRREALERVFYHDILNTATGLRVYLDLLKQDIREGDSVHIVKTLGEISESLIEEINSQRILTSAENGTLEIQPSLIAANEVIGQAAATVRGEATRRGVEIDIIESIDEYPLISDATILKRVLVNGIKNAVEASKSGETVTITHDATADCTVFRIHNPAHIPESVRLRLFYRYYSTKGANRGLGTYSMLLFTEKYLKGVLTIETDESRGTTLTCSLPGDVRSAN